MIFAAFRPFGFAAPILLFGLSSGSQAQTVPMPGWPTLHACAIAYVVAADEAYSQALAQQSAAKPPVAVSAADVNVREMAAAATSVTSVDRTARQLGDSHLKTGQRMLKQAEEAYALEKNLTPAKAATALASDKTPRPKVSLSQCQPARPAVTPRPR